MPNAPGLTSCELFLFHLNDHPAVLTPVAGLFILCFKLFEIGMFLPVRFITFRAVTPLEFLGGDHQVAVPAPQSVFLNRYQNKIHMPATLHNTDIVKNSAYRFNQISLQTHFHVTLPAVNHLLFCDELFFNCFRVSAFCLLFNTPLLQYSIFSCTAPHIIYSFPILQYSTAPVLGCAMRRCMLGTSKIFAGNDRYQ